MKRALILLLLAGCASQPVSAQLATACNSLATVYLTAAGYKAQGKLTPAEIKTLQGFEQPATVACDPTHPPANTSAALAEVNLYLQQWALINAGVTP